MSKLTVTADRLGLWSISTARLINVSRAALAIVAVVAMYLDPTQPSRFADVAYDVLAVYLAFALLVLVLDVAGKEMPALNVGLHFVDLGVCSIVLYFTEGPSSPFFVFFTFVLLAATMRWDWPSVSATAILLILLFAAISIAIEASSPDPIEDLNLLMMRVTYLVMVGVMLTFVGAYRMRVRQRIKILASWPPEHAMTSRHPPLQRSLMHAVDVMQARRALVIWEAFDEPYACIAAIADGEYRTGELSAINWQPSELRPGSFVVHAGGPGAAAIRGLLDQLGDASGEETLKEPFTYSVAAAAPFAQEKFRGLVLLFDPQPLDDELLVELAEIVAHRIGIEIEHYLLRSDLEDVVAERERIRLARDIHDDVLQAFTAARLQLNAIARPLGGETRQGLDRVSALLAEQQHRIRLILDPDLKRMAGQTHPDALDRCLRAAVSDVREQWDCEIRLKVTPGDAVIPSDLCQDLVFLLRESAANAVRHGSATCLEIEAERAPGSLSVNIRDNGSGFAGLCGSFRHEEIAARSPRPASILHRVESLGGRLTLETSERGSGLRIELSVR